MSGVKLLLTSKSKKIEKRYSEFDEDQYSFEDIKKRKRLDEAQEHELVKEIEGTMIQR